VSLRTKLMLSLALAIILGISLTSWTVYRFASQELAASKRQFLRREAETLARQTEAWLQEAKSNVAVLADLPLVRQSALEPGNPLATARACRFFQHIVETNGVFQTIDLLGPDATCLASSVPAGVGRPDLQRNYSRQPGFLRAAAGKANISSGFLEEGHGRPLIAIWVPVWQGRRVLAVLHAVTDMALYDVVFLEPEKAGSGTSYGIIDPHFNRNLPKGFKVIEVNKGRQYRPLEIPAPPAGFAGEQGFMQYRTPKGEILAAFHRLKDPGWIIVVQEPLREVLVPIRHMGRVAFGIAVFLISTVFGVVFLMVNPGVRGILKCLKLVQELGAGNLDARLPLRGNDEIGRLAKGLNTMAASLASQRQALEEAERTYREIFENAVEGIFRATGEQRIITANPSFARIMGYESSGEIIGRSLSGFFAAPAQQDAFWAELQAGRVVEGFEFTFRRRDGTQGSGSLFARTKQNEPGQITLIQGMLADITEKQKARRERQRAEEAESRLARSRLRALRYQINPHFLFNILNSIDSLAKQAPQRIPELIRQLSRYLRFTLTEHTNGLMPLNLELDAITSYLKLEKIRFEDDLVVEIITSPQYGQALVPGLLIQPLVENAIKYGLKTSSLPLRIAIRCTLKDKTLELEVANTGKWISEQEQNPGNNGIGLLNLRQRLELLYPDAYRLTHETRDGWIIVKVELPLIRDAGSQLAANI